MLKKWKNRQQKQQRNKANEEGKEDCDDEQKMLWKTKFYSFFGRSIFAIGFSK